MRAYWWHDVANFGDRLTPLLLKRLAGLEVTWSPASRAQIIACGSILGHLPRHRWSGIVWGAGKDKAERPVDLSRAAVLAVRGHLTDEGLHVRGNYAFGDPGLLCSQLGIKPTAKVPLGIMPHWQDRGLQVRYLKAMLISPRDDPMTVIRQIASCQRIVTSSLHGLIVADAFGIERRWETFKGVQGGGFKFRDHGSVVGAFAPDQWGIANRVAVETAQRELLDALAVLKRRRVA